MPQRQRQDGVMARLQDFQGMPPLLNLLSFSACRSQRGGCPRQQRL